MSSPEGFKSSPKDDFEKRMQTEYIIPMSSELQKIEELFPNLDPKSELADLLLDISYELNTMPDNRMDEDELRQNLKNLRSAVNSLQDEKLTEEKKMSIAVEGIKSSY